MTSHSRISSKDLKPLRFQFFWSDICFVRTFRRYRPNGALAPIGGLTLLCGFNKKSTLKRGEIRKQAKTLKSSRLWTADKQVTSE